MKRPQMPPGNTPDDLSQRATLLENALSGQGRLLAEARRAHALLASTFNAISDAIIVTDAAGQITQANEAVWRLFQRTPDDVLGDTCHSLLEENQGCPHAQACSGPGEEEGIIEQVVLNRAGDRVLNLRLTSVMDPEQQAVGFLHVIRDITRERILERHLMQAERMSLAGQMVSAVAHEVATPLSVVANIAEMLQLDMAPDAPTFAELGKIVTQVRRVTQLMRNLLDFTRQTPTPYRSVELGLLAQETLALLKYELRKAGIQTQCEIDPAAPPVWGDQSQLQQVILNLLTNAMQALKKGGRITLRIRGEDRRSGEPPAVALVVEDSGPGIAPEIVGKVFDFFYTTRSDEGGTGLGLAITKQIVEGHHGRIRVENMAGGGARFSVTLPAALPTHRAASSAALNAATQESIL